MQETAENKEFESLLNELEPILESDATPENREKALDINRKLFALMPKADSELVARASEYCNMAIDISKIYETAQAEAEKIAGGRSSVHFRPMTLAAVISKCGAIADVWLGKNVCPNGQFQNFNSHLHELLFNEYFGGEGEDAFKVKPIAFPISQLLFHIGVCYNQFNDIAKAIPVLKNACNYNITCAAYNYELAESYKMSRQFTKFVEVSKMGWQFSVTNEEVARFFRNMAFYYSELKQWKYAYINIFLSKKYEPDNEVTQHELDYIINKANVGLQRDVTEKMLADYEEKTGNPVEANPVVAEYQKALSERKQ